MFIQKTKGTFSDTGELIVPPTFDDKITGYVYTTIYSLVVIIFGALYKKVA